MREATKKFRLYVDETGNSGIGCSDNFNHRFLSLTGVIMDLDYVSAFFEKDFEDFKNYYFTPKADEKVILHRKEMINKIPPFDVLKDEKIELEFNAAIIEKLKQWEFKAVTALMDKKETKDKYSSLKYDPYHYLLEIIIERYIYFLKENSAVGDVMIESRGGKEDMRLKNEFRRLYENGGYYLNASFFKKYLTSGELKVKSKSNNIEGLQLADIIAHPLRNCILKKYKYIDSNQKTFGGEIIRAIQHKIYRYNKKIWGYGLKKLP